MAGKLYIDDALRLLNPERRDLEPEAGAMTFGRLHVRGIDKDARTVDAVFSTGDIDRYDEIILPEAFDLAAYRTNPVILAQHVSSAPNGAPSSIGVAEQISADKKALFGRVRFLQDDDLAEAWFRRYVQRVNRAFSVGVIVRKWEMRDVDVPGAKTKSGKRRLRVMTDVELVEISAVNIPANAAALVRAASLGMRGLSGVGPDDGASGGGLSNRRLSKVVERSSKAALRDAMNGDGLDALIDRVIARTIDKHTNAGPANAPSRQSSLVNDEPLIDVDDDDEWLRTPEDLERAIAEHHRIYSYSETEEAEAELAEALERAGL